ncbi:SLAP domain-containing protein [Alkalibacillus haloalkaliphilus]|uniref:SLAP domain-containing protein n=1 Tax=Alkalibacillus haloalkaliphilus TaxID=94136 RepID=UPI002936C08C|nr:SLAP domain-containing protein [Alkalibacillus haloalkaliphilus]MDV2581720.1 SLAP domain-containing protein [Alkalibacillus haloalkaliphilus]
MQKLVYEQNWENNLTEKDRNYIEEIFDNLSFDHSRKVDFTYLWQAINHRDDLLVTAIVHNLSGEDVLFNETVVEYEGVAKDQFSLPVTLDAHTSMPWTFIFNSYNNAEKVSELVAPELE